MTTIGLFRRDGDGFVGRLATLQIDATVRLTRVEKVSARAPEFRAFVGESECGAGWKPNDPASGAVLNLRLDDPTWAEPIDARLMAREEPLSLIWIRRAEDDKRDERSRNAPPQPTPPPAEG
ncbi:DUF736 family protein [Caulobacter sp. UNC358MFTsu5.1]|uniref:DUF736 domain-containing protein n=1 Tax=Caulobacter sp. UNC358MFTsu5.1 TaxID=1449049 RepID=UPI0009DD818E|nr:DUF736 family protein [Caulobacter sp. UNC358MFTsu5.1]